MQCIVNHQYKYLMFYAAKAGCSSLRTLYSAIHANEFTEQESAALNGYHNLNEVFPYVTAEDYSGYYKFFLSRNPFGRIVSAFIDQYTLAQHSKVREMLQTYPPRNGLPDTFVEFLEYLSGVPDNERDAHFRTQHHFAYVESVRTRRKLLGHKKSELVLDYVGDISKFDQHMENVYSKVFADDAEMLERALTEISNIKRLNSNYYSNVDYADAAELSLSELRSVVTPRPQFFFTSPKVKELVQSIYAEDFNLFGYNDDVIPQKKSSPELAEIPDDFDWQTYLMLGPDLEPNGINNKANVVRHYLEFGRYEDDRYYKVEAPVGFDWKRYLSLNADLRATGINNERDAIIHYLSFGIREGRET